jgi:hypothetical protein
VKTHRESKDQIEVSERVEKRVERWERRRESREKRFKSK